MCALILKSGAILTNDGRRGGAPAKAVAHDVSGAAENLLFCWRRIIKTEVLGMLKLSVVVFRRHENQHVKLAILLILR